MNTVTIQRLKTLLEKAKETGDTPGQIALEDVINAFENNENPYKKISLPEGYTEGNELLKILGCEDKLGYELVTIVPSDFQAGSYAILKKKPNQ